MSSKSRSELEYELGQMTAEMKTVLGELDTVNQAASSKLQAAKKRLKEDALAIEVSRRADFKSATAAYDEIIAAATTIKANLKAQSSLSLGMPASMALQAQLNLIQEVFGDL